MDCDSFITWRGFVYSAQEINSKFKRMLKNISYICRMACIFLAWPAALTGQTVLEIWQIQGSGGISPYTFQTVTTGPNVVTAVGSGFFFMQTPEQRSDGNALTAEGLLVIASVPGGVSVGAAVTVTGQISEDDGMTTLYAQEVTVTSAGAALPPAIALGPALPSPLPAALPSLERIEGMRVVIEEARVCGPSNFDEDAALSLGAALPQREPGILFPGQSGLPVWDGNPEIFWIDPDALNAPNNRFLSVGMRVSGSGVMMQYGERYFFLPLQYSTSGSALVEAVRPKAPGELTVGSYNALQLRTDVNNYSQRLAKAARYIVEALRAPDILALQEVGSLTALQDLALQIGQLDGSISYVPHFRTGNDDIHLAFLVKSGLQEVSVTQLGKDMFLSLGGRLHDRPPLLLEAQLPTTPPTSIAVLNLHLRSLLGIEGADANFVRTKRHEQAVSVAQMVQARQAQNLVVVGDFNAFPFTDGYVDVLSQIAGRSSLGAQFAVQPIVSPALTDHAASLPEEARYSYIFDGSAQQIDHCLSTALPDFVEAELQLARGNAGAALAFAPNTQLFQRSSDHDGLVLFLLPAALVSAHEAAPEALRCYPNPVAASQRLYIKGLDAPMPLVLFDALGRQVAEGRLDATAGGWVAPAGLPPGMYVAQVGGLRLKLCVQ